MIPLSTTALCLNPLAVSLSLGCGRKLEMEFDLLAIAFPFFLPLEAGMKQPPTFDSETLVDLKLDFYLPIPLPLVTGVFVSVSTISDAAAISDF